MAVSTAAVSAASIVQYTSRRSRGVAFELAPHASGTQSARPVDPHIRAIYSERGVTKAALRAKPVVRRVSVSRSSVPLTMVKSAASRPKAERIMAVGDEVNVEKAREMEGWLFIVPN